MRKRKDRYNTKAGAMHSKNLRKLEGRKTSRIRTIIKKEYEFDYW